MKKLFSLNSHSTHLRLETYALVGAACVLTILALLGTGFEYTGVCVEQRSQQLAQEARAGTYAMIAMLFFLVVVMCDLLITVTARAYSKYKQE